MTWAQVALEMSTTQVQVTLKCQQLGVRSLWIHQQLINNLGSGHSEYINHLKSDITPTQTDVAQEPLPTHTFQTCNMSIALWGISGLSCSLTQTNSDLTHQTQIPVTGEAGGSDDAEGPLKTKVRGGLDPTFGKNPPNDCEPGWLLKSSQWDE